MNKELNFSTFATTEELCNMYGEKSVLETNEKN
ncbi:Uncharacterized protein BM_BM13281, partial [Brugia malayi]